MYIFMYVYVYACIYRYIYVYVYVYVYEYTHMCRQDIAQIRRLVMHLLSAESRFKWIKIDTKQIQNKQLCSQRKSSSQYTISLLLVKSVWVEL